MSGRPLLCELHAHSTWSEGDLSIAELYLRSTRPAYLVELAQPALLEAAA